VEVRDALLRLRLHGPAHAGGQRFVGIPYVGRLQNLRMRDLLLKLFRTQADAVRLGQSESVILNVIGDGAFNLVNAVAAGRHHRRHVDPEDVLHARTVECAAVLLGGDIQQICLDRAGVPAVGRLFAGRDHADAPAQTPHVMRKAVLDQ